MSFEISPNSVENMYAHYIDELGKLFLLAR